MLLRLLNDGGANGGTNGGEKPKNGGANLEELIFTTIQDTPGINAPAIADTLKNMLIGAFPLAFTPYTLHPPL